MEIQVQDSSIGIKFTDEDLNTIGENSILGAVTSVRVTNGLSPLPNEVWILFPKSTYDQLKRNNGPVDLIINENVIPCLLKDVLNLTNKGVKVHISEYDRG